MSEPNNIPTITAKLALEDIAQLTKERDQLAAKCAEMRGLLSASGCINPDCGGKGWYAVAGRDQYGEPEQQQEQCQWCHEKHHALSNQCGEGWLSPEKKKVLMNILKDLADGNFPGTPLNNGSSAMRLVEQALEACKI